MSEDRFVAEQSQELIEPHPLAASARNDNRR
jgi:hypothetical protein